MRRNDEKAGRHELPAPADSERKAKRHELPAPADSDRKAKRHELLAPAGSYAIAKEVIDAGADAVYLAGERFGARAYASNLKTDELMQILDYAHLRGRQIHLTVNTLLKNREFQDELYDYIEPLYMQGLDAVIVQDFGVLRFLKARFPDLALHASTQMSVTSAAGAGFLCRCGASRIVAAREISLAELQKITEKDVEVESFIHGALCYSFSGQCLLSSMIGGRSGNRGRCAQPCRLPYQVRAEDGCCLNKKRPYPLSPKDLCALDLLPDLCGAGVYSFKIEGRMKQAGYAAGVTSVCRKYLDQYEKDPAHYEVSDDDRRLLAEYGSRSGFTKGYYIQRNGADMLSDRDPSYYAGEAAAAAGSAAVKIPVQLRCRICPGEPVQLSVFLPERDVQFCVSGDTVMPAQSRPLSADEVSKRLRKTGDTPFAVSGIDLKLDPQSFLPVSAVNAVRRKAFAQAEQEILRGYRRGKPGAVSSADMQDPRAELSEGYVAEAVNSSRCPRTEPEHASTRVMIAHRRMLDAVLASDCVDEVLLDLQEDLPAAELTRMADAIRARGKRAVYCFPYIFRADAQEAFLSKFAGGRCARESFDAFLVRSYDSLGFALDVLQAGPARICADYNLYILSENAAQAYRALGLGGGTVSPELNKKELAHQDPSLELQIYGLQPVMISAQCIYKNYRGCRKHTGRDDMLTLQEAETGHDSGTYAVRADCASCYNVIYAGRPLYLLDQGQELRRLGFASLRLSFVRESAEEIGQILSDYRRMRSGEAVRLPVSAEQFGAYYTRGHFHRGVE